MTLKAVLGAVLSLLKTFIDHTYIQTWKHTKITKTGFVLSSKKVKGCQVGCYLRQQKQADWSLWVWDQPGLHSTFQARQSYRMRLCLKNKQTNKTKQETLHIILCVWTALKHTHYGHAVEVRGHKLTVLPPCESGWSASVLPTSLVHKALVHARHIDHTSELLSQLWIYYSFIYLFVFSFF